MLQKEREITEIDRKINEKTRASIDEAQKQYYLREQMKVISTELYGDDSADEIDEYYNKLNKLDAKTSVKDAIAVHISKLSKERVEKVTDVINVGDTVLVKVIKIDEKHRVDLMLKEVLKKN